MFFLIYKRKPIFVYHVDVLNLSTKEPLHDISSLGSVFFKYLKGDLDIPSNVSGISRESISKQKTVAWCKKYYNLDRKINCLFISYNSNVFLLKGSAGEFRQWVTEF